MQQNKTIFETFIELMTEILDCNTQTKISNVSIKISRLIWEQNDDNCQVKANAIDRLLIELESKHEQLNDQVEICQRAMNETILN